MERYWIRGILRRGGRFLLAVSLFFEVAGGGVGMLRFGLLERLLSVVEGGWVWLRGVVVICLGDIVFLGGIRWLKLVC